MARLAVAEGRIRLASSSHTPLVRMVLAIIRDYPQRTILGLVLMGSQAFFYNAIFFTYALVLTDGICCRSRPETSSGRWFSAGYSTPSAAVQ